jgi:hypothetical protein
MSDGDNAITSALEALFPVDGEPDWEAVVAAADVRAVGRRRLAAAFAVVAVAAVSLVTPLGAELVHGLGGFSNWLTGEPGTPASRSEQRRFSEANARSWLGFPRGTRLRQLIATRIGDEQIVLEGFRSGTSAFCLRLTVRGGPRTGTVQCAPLADLKRADAPVRVLVADQPVGRGAKTAWYGVDKLRSARLQITAGIAADAVRRVILTDDHGRHVVPVQANSFLYVATDPEVGQRVRSVSAETAAGVVAVPFVAAPFALGSLRPPTAAPTVPVTAPARNGRVSWLEHHVRRGRSLAVLPGRVRAGLLGYRGGGARSRIVFGRLLTPDPSRPVRIALTLNAHRHGGPAAGICIETVTKGGAGGGCAPYPQAFASTPLDLTTIGGGSSQFVEVTGVASDAVARLTALLDNGQTLPIPLHDNVFDGQVPVAHLPARLVAYDSAGRVVGTSDTVGSFSSGPAPARGRAKQLLAARSANGAHAELLVGPATGGGECSYLRSYVGKRATGATIFCLGASWSGPPLRLGILAGFLEGRVRGDVERVRVDFAGGGRTTVRPTRGFVLAVMPPGAKAIRFVGIGADGRTVATEPLPGVERAKARRSGPS